MDFHSVQMDFHSPQMEFHNPQMGGWLPLVVVINGPFPDVIHFSLTFGGKFPVDVLLHDERTYLFLNVGSVRRMTSNTITAFGKSDGNHRNIRKPRFRHIHIYPYLCSGILNMHKM